MSRIPNGRGFRDVATRDRYSCLLLEDNPIDAELEMQYILMAGYEAGFTVVGDRIGFENAFATTHFDLILADYSLPDFDGLSALAIVRAKYGRLPFIFVSGVMGEDFAVETMRKGATDYVLKTKLELLVPAVERALKEHEEYLGREKAECELRAAQLRANANAERQSLLLRLLQHQRTSRTAENVMLETCQEVGEYLRATRTGFVEAADDDELRFLWQWTSEGHDPLAGLPMEALNADRIEQFNRGEILSETDIERSDGLHVEVFTRLKIQAFVGVPLLRSGVLQAGFFVAHDRPRDWTDDEKLFVHEVAEVMWDGLERARALSALQASELRLRTAAETANLGSWDLNLATGCMSCSDQCKANFGRLPQHEFNYPDLRAAIHPDDLAMVSEAVELAIVNRVPYRAEYRNMWPDGSIHWVVAAGRAEYTNAGQPHRMTGFTLDVTERHKAQTALLQSEKLAAVGRLASSIAHEINNPLESVTNLLYLASHSEQFSVAKEYLEVADKELRRVAGITNQTLRFHRQSGHAKPVAVDEFFSGVVGIFQRRFENSRISVSIRLRAKGTVECLDGEIRQVLTNLVSNAIDALRHGGTLMLRTRNAAFKGTAGVWFTVADDGCGIPLQVQARLYEAFFTTKDINGTGLGLWVSRQIVDRHRGHLLFRSRADTGKHGTVFALFLPCTTERTD